MLNRDGLDVLVHPLTDSSYNDHTAFAMWLGAPVALKTDTLRHAPVRRPSDAELRSASTRKAPTQPSLRGAQRTKQSRSHLSAVGAEIASLSLAMTIG